MSKMLIINPGSTSTKIAVYEDTKEIFQEKIEHSATEIAQYEEICDQQQMRKNIIEEVLETNGININELNAVVARGGLIRPIESGTYEVNEQMINDAKIGLSGDHASNLGCIIAKDFAKQIGIKAYIVDPVVVDELEEVAKFTGLPEIKRSVIFHALNQKSVARHAAEELEKEYDEVNLIVAHLGGGITVGAHKKGRVIDVNNGLLGEGPFSPERCGTLPIGKLVKLCYDTDITISEMNKKLAGKAGLTAYLGTNSGIEVNKMIDAGDKFAESIYKAMAYNVSKEIGSCAAVLEGDIDGIVLTGGQAYDERFVSWITQKVGFLGRIFVYPGEKEMFALAEGGLRILTGEEEAKEY